MNTIADALVYAVTYISLRGGEKDFDDDEDVGALESIAAMLCSATRKEKEALALAADRAFTEEKNGAAREEFLQDYGTWM
ncbi:MAG: hypothetical protein KDA84_26855, partial [Planctomycetaceae bacterium]|nr:hypothetical protein [Planctomycetaceae bacterium]